MSVSSDLSTKTDFYHELLQVLQTGNYSEFVRRFLCTFQLATSDTLATRSINCCRELWKRRVSVEEQRNAPEQASQKILSYLNLTKIEDPAHQALVKFQCRTYCSLVFNTLDQLDLFLRFQPNPLQIAFLQKPRRGSI